MSMEQKNLVITGAAGAIGSASVLRMLAAGANVLAVDAAETALAALADRARGAGGRFETRVADVTDPEQVEAYAQRAVDLWGEIDGFFNNAGVQIAASPIQDTPVDGFDHVMAVNVRGIFLGLKYVLPRMREGGSVINASSCLGLVGAPGVAAYVTSKHAIIGIARVAALEQGPRRVRVNAIAPGPIAQSDDFQTRGAIFRGQWTKLRRECPARTARYAGGRRRHGRLSPFGRVELRNRLRPCHRWWLLRSMTDRPVSILGGRSLTQDLGLRALRATCATPAR